MTVAFWSATKVCPSKRLLAVAPVCKVMAVLPRITPSMCEPAAAVTEPATTQTMLLASAPPARVILLPAAIVRVPATWKIQVSVAPPVMVMSLPILTPVVHLYNPGARMRPPMAPVAKLLKLGFTRPVASVKAVPISLIAVVRVAGVGTA